MKKVSIKVFNGLVFHKRHTPLCQFPKSLTPITTQQGRDTQTPQGGETLNTLFIIVNPHYNSKHVVITPNSQVTSLVIGMKENYFIILDKIVSLNPPKGMDKINYH